MRAEHQAAAKTEDFDPLVPIDVIRPPQHRGGNDPDAFIRPIEQEAVPESEIEEARGDVPDHVVTPEDAAVSHQAVTHQDVPGTPETPKGTALEEQEEEHKDFPDYKGDRNAPVDAEHPLANPPESDENLAPPNPRD